MTKFMAALKLPRGYEHFNPETEEYHPLDARVDFVPDYYFSGDSPPDVSGILLNEPSAQIFWFDLDAWVVKELDKRNISSSIEWTIVDHVPKYVINANGIVLGSIKSKIPNAVTLSSEITPTVQRPSISYDELLKRAREKRLE